MYVEFFNLFSAAVLSDRERSRDDNAPTSVSSDKDRVASGYTSLIAEINALDFSDDVTPLSPNRAGEENTAL